MAPRSFTRSEGLRLSLLALAASASIVGGVFVTAPPAFGDDALPDASVACLVAQGPESMASLSSIVHAGESVHVEGSGWGPGTEQIRGFVIITLDDGETKRPDGMELPSWVPDAVRRDRTAWAVADVASDGTFSTDIPLPSSWEVGSAHAVYIGDAVTGTYVEAKVRVVDTAVDVRTCSMNADSPDPSDPGYAVVVVPDMPGEETPSAPADSDPGESASTVARPAIPADEPKVLTSEVRGDQASDAQVSTSSSTDASAPPASASAGSSRPGSALSRGYVNGGSSQLGSPTPDPSSSTEQQSVSASEIGPRSRSEQQATEQAAREQEGRLNGWILAGGGALALLGAIATVSIVRKSHGSFH